MRESTRERHDGAADPPAGGRPVPARRGPVRREPGAPRCAPRDVRPLAVRACAPRGDRRVGGVGAARGPGLHRCRLRPRQVRAAADPGSRPADGPTVPRRGRRPLRGRHRRGRRQRDAQRRCRRRRARRGGLRPARRPGRSRRGARGRRAALSRSRDQRVHEPPGGARRGVVRRLRRRGLRQPGQPAAGRVPARGAGVCRRRGGRRTADPLALDADAAPGSKGPRGDPRPRASRGACRRTRRRRGLRGEAAGGRGDPPGLARAQDGTSRPLDGDAEREHDRDGPRSGLASRVHARRQPRRGRPGLPPAGGAGSGGVSAHRRHPPGLHGADGERCLLHPEDRGRHGERRHQHDPDRPVPRRRPTRGRAGDRAGDGSLRGRARERPSGGAAAQPLRRPTHSR